MIKRYLQIVFAPHLPSTSCFYYIDAEGVHGYKEQICNEKKKIDQFKDSKVQGPSQSP